jgi:hypothetical protein
MVAPPPLPAPDPEDAPTVAFKVQPAFVRVLP